LRVTDEINKIRFFLNGGLPSYLIFFVTSQCNARCKMCFNLENINDYSVRKKLSIEEINKISKNLNSISYLTLSGGEPFLRKDLDDICKLFYDNNSTRYIGIPTNGSLPSIITKKVEDILIKCPNLNLKIPLSIDALNEEHDKIRNLKGCFKNLLNTYQKLDVLKKDYNNLEIAVNTTFSSFNQDKIADVIEYVFKNFDIKSHTLTYVRGEGTNPESNIVSIKNYKKAVNRLEEISHYRGALKGFILNFNNSIRYRTREIIIQTLEEDRMIIPCVAGDKMAVIDDIGNVFPCEILGKKIGDLRKHNYNFKMMWNSYNAREIRQFIKDKRCHCTFECAIQNSIAHKITEYPSIIKRLLDS